MKEKPRHTGFDFRPPEFADLASVGAHTPEIMLLIHFADRAREYRPVHIIDGIPGRPGNGTNAGAAGIV